MASTANSRSESKMKSPGSVMSSVMKNDELRHYRISINLQSLQNIERSIFASFQFTYPHLGSAGVVRTSPQWFQPSSEVKIEKGAVSYELATTRARLETIFSNFPVKIDMLRRTNMENDTVGYAVVDLLTTFIATPYMYVCPVTQHTFKTIEEYEIHREHLAEQYAAQQIDNAPAKDPEVVMVGDYFLPMTDMSTKLEGEKPTVASAKLRIVIVIEDKGEISREKALRVRPGYKQHGAAVYGDPSSSAPATPALDSMTQTSPRKPPTPGLSPPPLFDHAEELRRLQEQQQVTIQQQMQAARVDWEMWREQAEKKWRESLMEKEAQVKAQAKQEAQATIEAKMDDLKRAQQEVGRMEVRLKAAMENVEKQRFKLQQHEEGLEARVAQKIQELQLLQRRVRTEAKTLVDAERQKNTVLQSQLMQSNDHNDSLERKLKLIEQEYLELKTSTRKFSETILREEVATVKAQLADAREQIEREKTKTAGMVLEKEHYRAQMYRLASALKREREKTSAMARQEVEHLRLEFLAREERFMLDGDRNTLHRIKDDLSALRVQQQHPQYQPPPLPQLSQQHSRPSHAVEPLQNVLPSEESKNRSPDRQFVVSDASHSQQQEIDALLDTGVYDEDDEFVQTIRAMQQQQQLR